MKKRPDCPADREDYRGSYWTFPKGSKETNVVLLCMMQDIREELKLLNATLKTTGFLAYHKEEVPQ